MAERRPKREDRRRIILAPPHSVLREILTFALRERPKTAERQRAASLGKDGGVEGASGGGGRTRAQSIAGRQLARRGWRRRDRQWKGPKQQQQQRTTTTQWMLGLSGIGVNVLPTAEAAARELAFELLPPAALLAGPAVDPPHGSSRPFSDPPNVAAGATVKDPPLLEAHWRRIRRAFNGATPEARSLVRAMGGNELCVVSGAMDAWPGKGGGYHRCCAVEAGRQCDPKPGVRWCVHRCFELTWPSTTKASCEAPHCRASGRALDESTSCEQEAQRRRHLDVKVAVATGRR